jgi:hypothetical protein
VARTAKTGDKRRATAMLRCYPEVKVRLEMLAERWHLDLAATLERMIPGTKIAVGECRYCAKITRAPTFRHRFHEGTCSLWADREPGAMA